MYDNKMAAPSIHQVLVTGGSGYVASHLILQLLAQGHSVRTTVRNAAREEHVRKILRSTGANDDKLSFCVADLDADAGWAEAVRACEFVHHVASPFPAHAPDDEDEIIRPAREGALRVLRFARDAGVKRVVMTSSFAAIGYGHGNRATPYTEKEWTELDAAKPVPAYHKSKTLAERAAWDFIQGEGGSLELTVVNPTGIFGPVLSADVCTSVALVKMMMEGKMAACPQLRFAVVDVRDVASLHILAMAPEAKGQRYIAACDGEPASLMVLSNVIRKRKPEFASKLPRHELPNIVVRIWGLFSAQLKAIAPDLGVVKRVENAKAKSLGWRPRSIEESIADTADSLVRLGAV